MTIVLETVSSYMQEEEDPLLHDLPLPTLIAWTRWWHLIQSAPLLPVPRLADHLDTDVGPSDEESGIEAKRQKTEPTTPISTCSRPPNEYDEVTGITQVDSREAERLRRGWNRSSRMLKKDHLTFLEVSLI